jgi:uncharacterized protein YxjI
MIGRTIVMDTEIHFRARRPQNRGTPKKWFHQRDSYGVEIEQAQNDILILAV